MPSTPDVAPEVSPPPYGPTPGNHFTIHGGSFTDVRGDQNVYNGNISTTQHHGPLNIHNGPINTRTTYHVQTGEAGVHALFKASDIGASHNSIERSNPPRCHPQTRQGILRNIHSWLQASVGGEWKPVDDSGRESLFAANEILWVYGPLGAGKTAIAQTVCETNAKLGQLAASFFFSRGTLGRGTARHLFPTLAFQIAMNVPGVRDAIGQAVEDDPSIFHRSLDDQAQTLILEPVKSTFLSTPYRRYLIVIDGLDECDSRDVQLQVISCLAGLAADDRIPLRFLILSRPDPSVRNALRLVKYNHLLLDSTAQAYKDVETFLRSGFDDIRAAEKHAYYMAFCPETWPSENDIKTLVKRSGGFFIYAATVLRFVGEEYYEPQVQLQIIMDSSSSHLDAFKELDNLYRQILSTIPNTALLLRILGYILTARPPPPEYKASLTSHVVEAVLGLRPGTVLTTLRGMHSILRVGDSNRDPTIECLHASFPSFIFDELRAGKFYIDTDKCHLDIAGGCLCFIASPAAVAPVDITRPTENPRSTIHFILNSWPFHFRRAVDKNQLYGYLQAISEAQWAQIIEKWYATSRRGYWECFDMLEEAMDVLGVQLQASSTFVLRALLSQIASIRSSAYETHLRHLSTSYKVTWVQYLPAIVSLFDVSSFLLSLHNDGSFSRLLGIQASRDDWYDIRRYMLLTQDGKSLSAGFVNFMNDARQSKDFFIKPGIRHANLTERCMDLLPFKIAQIQTRDREAYFYALEFWARHLSLSTPGDKSIWLRSLDPGRLLYSNCLAAIISEIELSQKSNQSQYMTPKFPRPMLSLLRSFPQHNVPRTLADLRRWVSKADAANIMKAIHWFYASPKPLELIISRWERELQTHLSVAEEVAPPVQGTNPDSKLASPPPLNHVWGSTASGPPAPFASRSEVSALQANQSWSSGPEPLRRRPAFVPHPPMRRLN